MSNNNKPVSEAQLLLFGCDRYANPRAGGWAAILKGESPGHIAMRLRFTDENLYNTYIKGTKIPCDITQENGRDVYEVYVSYGPPLSSSTDKTDKSDMLYPYEYDKLFSQQGTPSKIDKSTAKALGIGLDHRVLISKIPFLKHLIHHEIILNPTTIIHESLAGKQNIPALKTFAEQMEVLEDRRNNEGINEGQYLDGFNKLVDGLKESVFNDSSMTHAQVLQEINKYMTVGLPERDTLTIPLLRDNDKHPGFAMDKMLEGVRDTYDQLADERYDLTAHNCAHVLGAIWQSAVKGEPEQKQRMLAPFSPSIINRTLGAMRAAFSFFSEPANEVATPVDLMNQVIKAGEAQRQLQQVSGEYAGALQELQQEKSSEVPPRGRDNRQPPYKLQSPGGKGLKDEELDEKSENDPALANVDKNSQSSKSQRIKPL